eukprot:TRINITY_DN8487_c0_g1_i1.p1 TRINITY_DN8487_c0_g1~~TRINITY_DN8487_c0_g1_i1.p1  ORF type:complete len:325 (-),score=15.86 TRINITY_DN8487_c0_g1_i1:138-1052(-)
MCIRDRYMGIKSRSERCWKQRRQSDTDQKGAHWARRRLNFLQQDSRISKGVLISRSDCSIEASSNGTFKYLAHSVQQHVTKSENMYLSSFSIILLFILFWFNLGHLRQQLQRSSKVRACMQKLDEAGPSKKHKSASFYRNVLRRFTKKHEIDILSSEGTLLARDEFEKRKRKLAALRKENKRLQTILNLLELETKETSSLATHSEQLRKTFAEIETKIKHVEEGLRTLKPSNMANLLKRRREWDAYIFDDYSKPIDDTTIKACLISQKPIQPNSYPNPEWAKYLLNSPSSHQDDKSNQEIRPKH